MLVLFHDKVVYLDNRADYAVQLNHFQTENNKKESCPLYTNDKIMLSYLNHPISFNCVSLFVSFKYM